MPKAVTGRQAIQNLTSTPSQWTLGTVIETNVLARDKNNVILTSSRIVTVNYHGIGGLGRVELPTGIDPTNVSVNDDLLVLQQNGRALAVQHYPASNRTAAGSGGMGQTLALEKYSSDITVVGTIVGNQLELLWNPVPRAEYYQIWTSPTGDPAIDDATYVANSPSTSWVSKRDGIYFDDGMWYAVMAQHSNGQAGTLSPWVQPTFGGNYATGMLSQNQTTSIPGSLIVALSGSIVRATFTSVDSPTTFDVDVADPMAAHSGSPLFANGDILQFTDTSGNKLWVTVVSSSDQTTFWRYTVTKEDPSAGTNYTILTGSSVVDWGQSGQGIFIVSADGSFGPGTLWQIVTHTGTPWVSFTVQVSADATGQITAGNNHVLVNVNGIAIQDGGTGRQSSLTFLDSLGNEITSITKNEIVENSAATGATGQFTVRTQDNASGDIEIELQASGGVGQANVFSGSGVFLGLRVGDNSDPLSILESAGALGLPANIYGADTALSATDAVAFVNATATITLPDATTVNGRIYTVFLTDPATVVTVVDAIGANINGGASDILTVQYSAHTYQSNGTQWWIIGAV